MEKEKFLSKIFNKIKEGWEKLGEPDINDGVYTDKAIEKEVKEIEEVQVQVHNQRGFVQRAKVNEAKAKAKAEETDPVAEKYAPLKDIADKINEKEKALREGR